MVVNDKTSELHSIDVVKFMMALIVVAIHTNAFSDYPSISNSTIFKFLCSVAVPYFFVSIGYFVSKKKNILNISYTSSLRLTLTKMVKLYILWTAIYMPLTIYGFCTNSDNNTHKFIIILRNLLFIGEQYYSWHLWFLLATIYGLIFLLIFPWSRLGIITMIIFSCTLVCANYFSNNVDINQNYFFAVFFNLFKKMFGNGRVFIGLFYIIIGIGIHYFNITLKMIVSIIAILICLYIKLYGNTLVQYICDVFGVFFLFTFVFSIKLPFARIWIYFRKFSTTIYFTHMLSVFICLEILDKYTTPLTSFIYAIITSLVITFAGMLLRKCIYNKSHDKQSRINFKIRV